MRLSPAGWLCFGLLLSMVTWQTLDFAIGPFSTKEVSRPVPNTQKANCFRGTAPQYWEPCWHSNRAWMKSLRTV